MGVSIDESALDGGFVADDADASDTPPPHDAPHVIDTPLATDAPAATDAPLSTDAPLATDAPLSVDVATVDVPACPSGSSLCAAACVDLSRDPAHCGACGQRCPASPNAAASCGAGRCGVTCAAGYGDCDGMVTTGCEVTFATNVAHCGACGTACTSPHGTPACAAGSCTVASCEAGYGDCNSAVSDGCEVELSTSAAHCGACGRACATGQSCAAGVCTSPVWESFESGAWPWTPWTRGGSGSTPDWTAAAACAHDGARGLTGPSIGSRWYYRTDRTFGAAGERISAWVRATNAGRAYLGFGASSAGAWSFGFAPNTRQVVFFRHAAWGFVQITASAATFSENTWYRAEVTFGAGGAVTGRVYSEAGATVATLTTTIADLPTGGVALYAFNACVDTIELR